MAKRDKEPPPEPDTPRAGPELEEAHRKSNERALSATINELFHELDEVDGEIEVAKATYVEPLKAKRKEIWKKLKDTDIDRTDIDLFFALFRRQKAAGAFEVEADRIRVFRNMRTIFNALQEGGQLDLVSVLEADQPAPPPAANGKEPKATAAAAPQFSGPSKYRDQGKAAFAAGHKFDTCGYKGGTAARDEWEAGFHEAMAAAEAAKAAGAGAAAQA